jgi:hypothetical protein
MAALLSGTVIQYTSLEMNYNFPLFKTVKKVKLTEKKLAKHAPHAAPQIFFSLQ